ncbi:hypothetical protein ACE38W_05040 [Chitinophaga sp. Hz27]|uniref:hypothetical protein n=1 Tax=Chitinophaga sp. Hz27 TaxID=3347169 RepID=UPI0035E18A8C
MQNQYRHHLVNWVNGMKIQQQHFVLLENAMLERVASAAAITLHEQNFGLLTQEPAKASCELTHDMDGSWKLRLLHCNGITPDGLHIQLPLLPPVTGFVMPGITYHPLPESSETCFVIVEQHIYERIPVGDIDTTELPYRNPAAIAEIHLKIIAANIMDQVGVGPGQIVLARILSAHQKPVIDQQYIPPCMYITSHHLLIDYFNDVHHYLSEIMLYANEIIRHIRMRENNQDLAACILEICKGMGDLISYLLPELAHITRFQGPVYLFTMLSKVTGNFQMLTTYRIGQWREQVFNYFALWLDITPGVFESMIWAARNIEYYHLDIAGSLKPGLDLLSILHKLTKNISQLEYIGVKPDNKIFVKEELQREMPDTDNVINKKNRWRFTD